jgi:hypothetical protein
VAEPVIEQTFQIVAGPKALLDLSFYANGNITFVYHPPLAGARRRR